MELGRRQSNTGETTLFMAGSLASSRPGRTAGWPRLTEKLAVKRDLSSFLGSEKPRIHGWGGVGGVDGVRVRKRNTPQLSLLSSAEYEYYTLLLQAHRQ
jgi:hypothetical protein